MKELYKNTKPLPTFLQWICSFLCGAAYVVCCLPSFYWIGKLFLQMVSALVLSLIWTVIVFFFVPRCLPILGRGLSLFLMAMILFAVYQQIIAQRAAQSAQLWWVHTFFYDRPFTVSLVWAAAFVSLLILRLVLPHRDTYAVFRADFSQFFRTSFRWFLVFYAFVLIYCFILQRPPGGDSGFNLVPFAMIVSYFQSFRYAYESSFYLLGNLLCFFPFGFYLYIRHSQNNLWLILLTPVLLSLLIEVSQLLFSMGHFDIDDILMNAFGYYVGFGIAFLFDVIRKKITKGEEPSIFTMQTPQA